MRLAFALLLVVAAQAAEVRPLAITNVTVIDTQAGRARPGMTVIVTGDRIAAAGPSRKVKPPSGAEEIDGQGRFLIPGLWDMHVHMRSTWDVNALDEAPRTFYSPWFLANGITGVRGMWDNIASVRKSPLRVVASGNMLDGPQPSVYGAIACATPEQGREGVVRLKQEGADFIKVYSGLPRDVYLAIAEESRKLGLPFAGHVPNTMSVAEASDAGQKSVEHLLGIFAACSSLREDADRLESKFGAPMRAAAERYDAKKAEALFARFVRNGTWQCPTLAALRSVARFGDPEFMKDERIQYLPPVIRRLWKTGGPGMDAQEDLGTRRRQFERELRLVGAMHRAGVRILAGSDTPNPYVFPGASLHDELELLVEAGLSPIDALRTATIRPAECLGMTDRLGTVAPGKLADLVLLDGDPLLAIANTRRVHAVVLNGKLYRKPDLDRMVAGARAAAVQ